MRKKPNEARILMDASLTAAREAIDEKTRIDVGMEYLVVRGHGNWTFTDNAKNATLYAKLSAENTASYEQMQRALLASRIYFVGERDDTGAATGKISAVFHEFTATADTESEALENLLEMLINDTQEKRKTAI